MDDNGVEERDRLSELPDSLILHILSWLPMRDVVSTTLVSKRWNNLWTTSACLNICCAVIEDGAKLRNFFNRALIFWKPPRILELGIHVRDYFENALSVDVDLWVRFAVVNKVEVLNISLSLNEVSDWEDRYWVPHCLNSCSSLTHLFVDGCNIRIHEPPSWNQLQTLNMDGSSLDEHSINQILLGCPKLEVLDLLLLEDNENLTIHSMSLKVLKIEKLIYVEEDGTDEPSVNTVLSICCPNLKTLEISGVLYSKCLFTNVSYLTDVTLGFCSRDSSDTRWKYCLGVTLVHIFSTTQHVERVALSSWCAQVLGELQEKYMPSPLPNVKFLKLNDVYITKLGNMMDLFEIFPNLEMLVFEDLSALNPQHLNANEYLDFGTIFSKSLSLQLKTVVITSHDMLDSSIMQFIEFLLKHASVLEKLVILDKNGTSSEPGWCLLKVAQTLLSMPRSSPTVKVIFDNECETQDQLCSICGI